MEASDVVVVVRGRVPDDAKDHARRMMASLADVADGPVLLARVSLDQAGDPARERPAIAKGVLDVNGRPIRAHVAAATMDQALHSLRERLREGIERDAERRDELRRRPRGLEEGEWRGDAVRSERPAFYPRPVEEREIVRHKSYRLGAMSAQEAVWEMDALDHDFHLFVNSASGRDALLVRRGFEFDLFETEPATAGSVGVSGRPIRPSASAAPVLSIREALTRIGSSSEPFLFFVDRSSRRGTVLYLRYDGHYGLITPEAHADLTEGARRTG